MPAALGLERQPWFHGEMERGTAEALIHYEGDFLVRISPNTANNFVLSGIANSVAKHFLLLDENDYKVSSFLEHCSDNFPFVITATVEAAQMRRGEAACVNEVAT